MLFEYQQSVQRFLRDARMQRFNPSDLTNYINRARRMTAYRAECCRVLTPISGSITGWTVTNPGTGYSANPTFTVSAPDFPSGTLPSPEGAQATAAGIVSLGQIQAIFSQFGGYGYFQPTMTITDPTGSGATATPTMSFINQLNEGQEVYPLSTISFAANPGVRGAFAVIGITVIYANYRYTLRWYDFATYQAKIRQYPFQYKYVPSWVTQFNQGSNASFYVYPLPSQHYQYECDCLVFPSDLVSDNSPEIIPFPWSDAVPFYAMHLASLEAQQLNAAAFYLKLFEDMMPKFSVAARPWRTANPYGRY